MDQPTLQKRATKLFVAVIVFLVIALVLQIVGFSTLGWLIYKYGSESAVQTGLWSKKTCIRDTCTTVDHTENTKYDIRSLLGGMLEYQIETSIALGLLVIATIMYSCLMAIVLFGCTRCGSCSGKMKLIVHCIVFCLMTSGILAIIAAAQFGNHVRKLHDTYKLTRVESPIEVPYSLILTGIGGIIAGVMGPAISYSWRKSSMPPPRNGIQTQPNVMVYHGHPQAGYNNQNQPMVQYTAPPQGYTNQAPYAGQPHPDYMYQAPNAGQPHPGYMYQGQPSAPYAGQTTVGHKL